MGILVAMLVKSARAFEWFEKDCVTTEVSIYSWIASTYYHSGAYP
ncbi:hypothetical protein [Dulcicalothrix desertica]|nr:hypothetical protein [Dulcicalothrix desertica]